jgi:hypothetical protein
MVAATADPPSAGRRPQEHRSGHRQAHVDGARVRDDALTALADAVGGAGLRQEVRRLLTAHPPPADPESDADG